MRSEPVAVLQDKAEFQEDEMTRTDDATLPGECSAERARIRLTARDGERRRGLRVWIVTVDGRRVGIVGDERLWRGTRWGGLRWWAALRNTDDWTVPAAWNTGDEQLRTRTAAVDALIAALRDGGTTTRKARKPHA